MLFKPHHIKTIRLVELGGLSGPTLTSCLGKEAEGCILGDRPDLGDLGGVVLTLSLDFASSTNRCTKGLVCFT